LLVLVNKCGQVLATAAAVLLAAATLAVAAAWGVLLVVALAPRRLFTEGAFEEHRLSGVHILRTAV